ncbi:MAG: hypothetical protein CMJ89_09305 [Planctomycetes bacterium]|nr:hypothetical protein [Planctomycetota bacterium]
MADEQAQNEKAWESAEHIFCEALDLQESERMVYVEKACRDVPELRGLVDSLLAVHQGTVDDWDDAPPGGSVRLPALESSGPRTGEIFGRYRILHLISAGGMGTVYEAVQDKPQRSVALKIMRDDLISADSMRRFNLESQVLARLRHPNIAQVYDAGTVDRAERVVPFIAMELVPGARSLDEYAEEFELDRVGRLALFAKVCDAVQHGHTRGVIHRDLKPANILVDQNGEPKVIDFGVARVTNGDLKATTRQTSIGKILGTVSYMSPEQCAADPDEIDTRSDVYALGVVLFKLLTRRLPYPIERVPIHVAVRVIQQDPPTQLGSIDRAFRGDLDTIVGKAIEKNKQRRYQTAHEFAADIRRHLNDEPIAARPPSRIYQLRKFARRHTALVVSAALVLVLLVTVASITTPLYFTAESARAEAESARAEAETAQIEAETARDDALAEARKSAAVVRFLIDTFRVPDPERAKGNSVSAREILDQAVERIQTGLAEDPQTRRNLMLVIGEVYSNLGLYRKARELIEPALEEFREESEPFNLAGAVDLLGEIAWLMGDDAAAEPLLLEASELRRTQGAAVEPNRRTGPLRSLAALYTNQGQWDKAQAYLDEAQAVFTTTDHTDSAEMAELLGQRARILGARAQNRRARGKDPTALLQQAEGAYKESLALYKLHREGRELNMAEVESSLGLMLKFQGRLDEAEPYYRSSIEKARTFVGEEHPTYAGIAHNFAALLESRGKHLEALPYSEQAVKVFENTLEGEDHPDLMIIRGKLAALYFRTGLYAKAEEVFEQNLPHQLRIQPAMAPYSLVEYAHCLTVRGAYAEALAMLEEAGHKFDLHQGATHPDKARVHKRLADLFLATDRPDDALIILTEGRALLASVSGYDNADASLVRRLGQVHEARGELEQAEERYREAYEKFRNLMPGSLEQQAAQTLLGRLLLERGKLDEAQSLLTEVHAELRASWGDDCEWTRVAAEGLEALREAGGD